MFKVQLLIGPYEHFRKKSDRLDWMYAGPAAMVERDEYLLGRQVDKTFEVMDLHAQGLMDKSGDDGKFN